MRIEGSGRPGHGLGRNDEQRDSNGPVQETHIAKSNSVASSAFYIIATD